MSRDNNKKKKKSLTEFNPFIVYTRFYEPFLLQFRTEILQFYKKKILNISSHLLKNQENA